MELMGEGLLLVNRELVLLEIAELTALKVSGIMKVPTSAVKVYFERDGERLFPCLDINPSATQGLTPATVRQVISSVYDRLKIDLRIRLNELRFKRPDFHPDPEDNDDNAP